MTPIRSRWPSLGAGLMGHGIAQVLAHGRSPCRADRHRRRDARHRARAHRAQSRRDGRDERRPCSSACARSRRSPMRSPAADLVIESVSEVVDLKQALFAEVAALAPPHAILTSNTSVIPITRLGERLDDEARGRLVGTHWWNPPHLIPLVEVVRTTFTRQDVVDRTVELLRDAGQGPRRGAARRDGLHRQPAESGDVARGASRSSRPASATPRPSTSS